MLNERLLLLDGGCSKEIPRDTLRPCLLQADQDLPQRPGPWGDL